MGDYIADAGPLAWPAIILGILGLVAATVHAVRQGRRQEGLAKSAIAGSLILALLNAVLGYQYTISYRDGAGELDTTLVFAGIGESLNGLVVSLAIALLVSLLFIIAAFRQRNPTGAP